MGYTIAQLIMLIVSIPATIIFWKRSKELYVGRFLTMAFASLGLLCLGLLIATLTGAN